MSCSSCENNLTKKTLALPGVLEANFSVLTKQAKVVVDVNKGSVRKVLETINYGKFTAELKGKREKTDIRDTIEQEKKNKQTKMTVSIILWIPILILIWIVPNLYPLSNFTTFLSLPNGPTLYVFITAAFSLSLMFYLGAPLFKSAWNALLAKTSNMDTLIVIGCTASILYGIFLFIYGYSETLGDKEAHFMRVTEHAHSFEVASTILVIISIGKYLESYARAKTVQKLSDLASIKVTKALLFTPADTDNVTFEGEEKEVAVELLGKNDLVKVINGQIIPTDCSVVYGQGFCNEAMLTGESRLAKKDVGSKVYGGTLLEKGSMILRVEVIEEESSLNQILKLVENAQTNKAPIQQYADRISSYFVPTIIICAIVAWIIWFVAVFTSPEYFSNVRESKFSFAFTFGISTVIIACPCALGLATPTAVMVCSGIAANLGILIKGGNILEKASKINTVVFDKTGTLTEGIPEVTNVVRYDEKYNDGQLYYLTKVCEEQSEHPIGKAIVNNLKERLTDEDIEEIKKQFELQEFTNFNGEGISCQLKSFSGELQKDSDVKNCTVLVGNEKLMHRHGAICNEQAQSDVTLLEEQGKTVIQVAVDQTVVMVIALEEKHLTKPEADEVCQYLRDNNFDVHMITGDHKFSALKIANKLNLKPENVLYRAYPEDKKAKVEYLQRMGRKVMFIGDGVNDSPVLSQSDVGVAINSQSDITVDAADVVIIKDNLISVIDTIRITKASFRRIKINFFWAFIYNVILIPIAMGILYPIVGFRLSPHLAALAMALSSVSVVLSSLMLKLYRPY
jgi:Cu+-exporting ATPase